MNTTETTTAIAVQDHTEMAMGTVSGFQALQRAGRMLSASSLVPEQYRGEQGLPNAVIALDMANRMGANPLMVMQNLYIVHGRPAWSSTFLIATVNACGRFSAMRFETTGSDPRAKGFACRAVCTEKATGEKLAGTWITWAMVDGEGWAKKAGSKWVTMPEQMFRYRAATFWARAYAPEIGMGLSTVDEAEDLVVDVTPVEAPQPPPEAPKPRTERIKAAAKAKAPEVPASVDRASPATLVDLCRQVRAAGKDAAEVLAAEGLVGDVERFDSWPEPMRIQAVEVLTSAAALSLE